MYIHDERLPGEDISSVSADEKTVRLTLTSRHIVARQFGSGISMFDQSGAEAHARRERSGRPDLPEGFSPEAIADFDRPRGDGDDSDEWEDDGDEAIEEAEELLRKMEEFFENMSAEEREEEEEDNTYVFKTLGRMRRTTDAAGNETVEIEYGENESMENTRTVIAFTPSQNNRVSILHNGAVSSGFVCERGVRHISVYQSPVMPIEVAICAKRCDGNLSFARGGFLELDYLVELRGMDVQRTLMTIDVVCLDM